ncbi:hypothetical protein BH23BAC1_BH23BAC1_31200 [soil metagenome]
MHKSIFPFFAVLIFNTNFLLAQEISPRGKFLADSIRIGEPVNYSLAIKYPKNMQIIFPDSTFNFYPFEFIQKKFSFTRSDSLYSYDSTTYILSSFELDQVQYLTLPVFIISGRDSIPVMAAPDSVFLKELVVVASDTLLLRENLGFREVETELNYPYILFGLALIVVVFVVVYLIFGKKIEERIRLYRLKKSHNRFKERYTRLLDELKHNNLKHPEEILIVWKEYMEDLEKQPFTKQTSKEIVLNSDNETLKSSLRSIDRSIYGNISDQHLIQSFENLSEYSEIRYNHKVQEVNNE